ncbi:hypothetical protein RRSWK_06784 [Rhodopirellula sp. SWK7]|nr:hypothetical protein RRSWK_06784 [Rhodopirellula sp. SWK7]
MDKREFQRRDLFFAPVRGTLADRRKRGVSDCVRAGKIPKWKVSRFRASPSP